MRRADSRPPKLPSRSRPSHGVNPPAVGPVLVFLTVCTSQRRRWLAQRNVQDRLLEVWADNSRWRVGRYVLLPDHLHLFAAPTESESDFDRWVRYWKSLSRRNLPKEYEWQEQHWDRRLRSGESYADTWEYVRSNPVRHGLASHPDEWQFQGELNKIDWPW